MEVKANVAAEQVEVLRVMCYKHRPDLPGRQDDEQVVPEGQDLGAEMWFLPADLIEMPSGARPGTGVWRHNPAHPVGPVDEVVNGAPARLARCAREEIIVRVLPTALRECPAKSARLG